MPQDRFFLDAPLESHHTLEDAEFHHLKVLRIAPGDSLELVNGRGALAIARLLKLEKHSAHLEIVSQTHQPPPSPTTAIAIALLRMNKLEWAIEKATELGADEILLFPADHSEKDSLSPHQHERLRHLAISALKQCGRLYLPPIRLTTIEDILLNPHILYGDTSPTAPPISPSSAPTLFLSGPEQGFSPRETLLLQAKATGVKLNPNILRAETAPLAALSILKGLRP